MARVNVQASSAPQQGLPFLNSLPLMLANVVFPLTQHLASGGTPVGKVGAGEGGGQRERVMPTQSSKGRSATFPNQPDTCFGKTGPKLSLASLSVRSAFCSPKVCDHHGPGPLPHGAAPPHGELTPRENRRRDGSMTFLHEFNCLI